MSAQARIFEHTTVKFDGTVRGLIRELRNVHSGATVVDLERGETAAFLGGGVVSYGWTLTLEREVWAQTLEREVTP